MHGSRNFCQGVQARLPENSSDVVGFFFSFFFSSQLILQFDSGLSMVYFKENYNFQGGFNARNP